MTLLEQEIIEKFHQLDSEAQRRVREQINQETVKTEPFDYDGWFASIEAIREEIRQQHGGVFPRIDAIGMLREIRD
jgi:hypothetical protein